jgi:hypothetical protein
VPVQQSESAQQHALPHTQCASEADIRQERNALALVLARGKLGRRKGTSLEMQTAVSAARSDIINVPSRCTGGRPSGAAVSAVASHISLGREARHRLHTQHVPARQYQAAHDVPCPHNLWPEATPVTSSEDFPCTWGTPTTSSDTPQS